MNFQEPNRNWMYTFDHKVAQNLLDYDGKASFRAD